MNYLVISMDATDTYTNKEGKECVCIYISDALAKFERENDAVSFAMAAKNRGAIDLKTGKMITHDTHVEVETGD